MKFTLSALFLCIALATAIPMAIPEASRKLCSILSNLLPILLLISAVEDIAERAIDETQPATTDAQGNIVPYDPAVVVTAP